MCMQKVCSTVLYTGFVQGLFFRKFVSKIARKYNLVGEVENLASGKVRAVFEGESSLVAEALAEIKQGKFFIRIDKIEVATENPRGEHKDFQIKKHHNFLKDKFMAAKNLLKYSIRN